MAASYWSFCGSSSTWADSIVSESAANSRVAKRQARSDMLPECGRLPRRSRIVGGHVHGALRERHHAAEHRLEERERQRFPLRVECRAVVARAELGGALERRVAAKALAQIPVAADVMEEVVALEHRMLLDHPVVLFRYERLHDRRGDVGMV